MSYSLSFFRRLSYLFFILSSIIGVGVANATIPTSERQALLDLYTSTNGSGWTTSTNWNGAVGTECTWYGVTCDGTNAHVTGLDLSNNDLSGSFSNVLISLPNLVIFYASNNSVTPRSWIGGHGA